MGVGLWSVGMALGMTMGRGRLGLTHKFFKLSCCIISFFIFNPSRLAVYRPAPRKFLDSFLFLIEFNIKHKIHIFF